MITLYCIGQGFGLPEISPYATKAEVQLKIAGLDYRKAKGWPDRSPKGQVPYIEDEDELIATPPSSAPTSRGSTASTWMWSWTSCSGPNPGRWSG